MLFSVARPAGNVEVVKALKLDSARVNILDAADSRYEKEKLRGKLAALAVHPGDDTTNVVIRALPLVGKDVTYPPDGGEIAVRTI